MHTTNYQNTLILPAEDCKTQTAIVPPKAGSVAAVQYDVLGQGGMTGDDILVAVTGIRRDIAPDEWDALRAEIFAKGQPCLRTSPLVKTHGWAVYHDAQAHVSLVDPASAQFAQLLADPAVTKVKGMRSTRK